MIGNNRSFALPEKLADLIEQVKPFASRIEIRTVNDAYFSSPGRDERANAGETIEVLYTSPRSNKQLIDDRSRDFGGAARALRAYQPTSSNRLRNISETQEVFDGTRYRVGRESLNTNDANVSVETEYLRLPASADAPDGFMANRQDIDRDPVAINTSIRFGKFSLFIRFGAEMTSTVRLRAAQIADAVRRPSPTNQKMIEKQLASYMETKWTIVDKNKIKVPDFALAETIAALEPIAKGAPAYDVETGIVEMNTAAGKVTIEGVSNQEMTSLLSTAKSIPERRSIDASTLSL